MSLAKDLFALAQRVALLEKVNPDDRDHETVYGYYYAKGALDYRDKLLEAIGGLPRDRSVMEAFQMLLGTFPDEYPGPNN